TAFRALVLTHPLTRVCRLQDLQRSALSLYPMASPEISMRAQPCLPRSHSVCPLAGRRNFARSDAVQLPVALFAQVPAHANTASANRGLPAQVDHGKSRIADRPDILE